MFITYKTNHSTLYRSVQIIDSDFVKELDVSYNQSPIEIIFDFYDKNNLNAIYAVAKIIVDSKYRLHSYKTNTFYTLYEKFSKYKKEIDEMVSNLLAFS